MPIAAQYVVPHLAQTLEQRALPTITVWNRLEGRPRRDDFSRALAAEVRDPLWMLTKQWQIGEFQGEDAGSPIFAKVRLRSSPVNKVRPAGGATEPYDGAVPLEAKVERQPIAWRWNGQRMRLDLRAQVGRQWRKLLEEATLVAYVPQYVTKYAFAVPPRDATSDVVHAHRGGWQALAALAGRAIDGGDLLEHIAGGGVASAGITLAAPADEATLDGLGDELAAWFTSLYLQPDGDNAWKPSYLEYQVACSAPQAGAEVVLSADEYATGHLDWFSFDRVPASNGLGGTAGAVVDEVTITPFIPTPVAFEGMPDTRWWALEDRKTDFGAVKPSTNDLPQLLLIEFGLVYANDWFLLPVKMPAGTLARVEGLAVTNNFGERTWINAAGAGARDNWHRWGMFQITSPASTRTADPGLFIPPATSRTLDGRPIEEIELARDEVANMVWAVERVVPSITGQGRAGKDEARETRRYHEALVAAASPPPPDHVAAVAYQAMTTVPEHWIPFIPVHVPGSTREIQLQRGRMPRIIDGASGTPPKVPPRTTVIRHGLDRTPAEAYFVHEEEVPRAGAIVRAAFRRTRWTGGEAYTWLGFRKQSGRGERGSNLAFDSLVAGKTS